MFFISDIIDYTWVNFCEDSLMLDFSFSWLLLLEKYGPLLLNKYFYACIDPYALVNRLIYMFIVNVQFIYKQSIKQSNKEFINNNNNKIFSLYM